MRTVLAFDLGASSGRALLGTWQNKRLQVEEILRFPNQPVQMGNHLYWDILRLYHEIKQGLLKAKQIGKLPDSIGIDSWGVDYCLISKTGELVGNPYHYRDNRTDGMMEEVFELVSKEEIFARTGNQFLPFNTIFQLFEQKQRNPSVLTEARYFLMLPAAFRYFLTGQVYNEFSHATTTQLYNPGTANWDDQLLERLGIPADLFGQIVEPGTKVGHLQKSLCEELGLPPIPVVAVAEHDTGSAVAAVPAEEKDFIYLSCGTWSLMGTEIENALMNEQTLSLNFTNEGGVNHSFRLLQNIAGLWLLQESQRKWQAEGNVIQIEEMMAMAKEATPFQSLIDPDHPSLLNPVHMPESIQQFCRQTGQVIPQDVGQITRCVLESLALKYRYVLECTQALTGKEYSRLYLVGGGSRNRLLCQFTANAIGKPVWAGPSEASATGNILVQLIALGEIADVQEARKIVRDSFPIDIYEPENQTAWERAYASFLQLAGLQIKTR